MSDTTPDAAPAEPAEQAEPAKPDKIDFERADFAEPAAAHVECGLCKRAITTEYWQYLGKVLCDACRGLVQRSADDARRGATLGKAFALGGVVALGCGIGYAIFVGLTKIQFALVTIGIGWAVGRSIQRITRGFGGRRHQVLAVALTYFASTMGYFPAILGALNNSTEPDHTEQDGAPLTSRTATAPAPAAADTAAPAEAKAEAPPPPARAGEPEAAGPGSVVLALVFTVALMLAAPFLELADGFNGVLGLLIIFFGLQTAWRVSRGVQASVTGPYKVTGPAGPAGPAGP